MAGALCAGASWRTARAAEPPRSGSSFDVRAHGATGSGKAPDTAAIQKAIDAAAAAGGGTVIFPAGEYLSYTLHLKSNVGLYLDPGAKLIAADAPAAGPGYDLPEPNAWAQYQDFGHSHFRNSLLYGEDLENVSILGAGLIWGKGLSKGYGPGPRAETPGIGNKAIALKNCHNVTLRDFAILQGGHFGILATGVDNLTVDNLRIDTNRDGIDIDCCYNVRVSNMSVNSPWDDGICLKSDYALGSARQTEMVTIANCYVAGCFQLGTLLDGTRKPFAPGTRVPHTGRIKFGTESNGGFRNIAISNCLMEGSQSLSLESVDGALLEDVTITNIAMRNLVTGPLFLRLGRRMRAPAGAPIGTLKRVIISNLVCSGAPARQGSIITGIPGHPIEHLKLANIQVLDEGGGTREQAAIAAPEQEEAYPDPGRFGAIPAHGFFLRHVKDVQMNGVEVLSAKPDMRPAFVFDDVDGAALSHIEAPRVEDLPVFDLRQVTDFELRASHPLPDQQIDKTEKKTI